MNKEFKRMQKLAGIITEGFMGQFYAPEYLEQKYGKKMASKITDEIDEMDPNSWDRFTEFTSAEEVEDYISDIKDDLGITESMAKKPEVVGLKKGKMSKEEAKKRIKEAILAELETTAGINAYDEVDSLDEAKKKKEDEEEVDVESDVDNLDLDLDTTDTEDDTQVDMDMDATGDIDAGSSESKKAFSELTDAYRAAKELGDEKLIRQIANTITYFNKNIILKQG